MALSADFWKPDGTYSWIVLAVLVINSTMVGLLYTVVGVMTYEYPQQLNIAQTDANLVGSILFGVFLFTGEYRILFIDF